jgi:hypothetical protein
MRTQGIIYIICAILESIQAERAALVSCVIALPTCKAGNYMTLRFRELLTGGILARVFQRGRRMW